jgi:hemolysin activation/secretion protein
MWKTVHLTAAIVIASLTVTPVPSFALGVVNVGEIQSETSQLQAFMIQLNRERLEMQEMAIQNAEIQVNQEEPLPQSQGPAFKVNKIILVGNTIFSTDQLSLFFDQYEGRTLHLKDLQDLALMITSRYQLAGYVTSRAFIPPQKIYDGKVIIRVAEGRVGQISISGNRYFSDQLYFDRLQIDRGQFFDMQQLAMSLQDINQLPDRFVKAYLEPGLEPGTSNIVIVAQEQNPLHASIEYNNQGTELTHWSRGVLHLTDNNLTGHGDSLQISVSGTDQNSLLGGMIQYVLPKPQDGLTYSLNGGYDYSRLEKDLRPLKVTSTSIDISPGVTKSFIKAPRLSVDGFMGIEYKDSKTLVDRSKLSYDRSRVVDVGPRVAITDDWGKTFISGDMRGGIPDIIDGAKLHDPEASRYRSGGEFGYITSSVDRINRLPFGSYLVLHGGGQYSPMPLTSLEQFYLGGIDSVRGYPESDASGDSGVGFSAELRIPPYFIPEDWHVINSKDKTWRDSLSIVTFVDGGRTFNFYRQEPGSAKDSTLLSAGAGLRYYISPDMNCQVGIGFPFGEAPSSGDKRDQMYLSARVGF